MNDLASFLPIAVLLVFAYLLLIRPARKRQQESAALQSALSTGDQVMLTSGIFGTVTMVTDENVSVEVSPGVVLQVHRAAIGKIVRDEPVDESTADDRTGSAGAEGDTPLDAPSSSDSASDGTVSDDQTDSDGRGRGTS